MSDQFLRVFESFKDQSPLTLLVTLFVVVLSLSKYSFFEFNRVVILNNSIDVKVVFWVLRRRPASKKNVLLLGTSNSGKTRIFCQVPTSLKLKLRVLKNFIFITKKACLQNQLANSNFNNIKQRSGLNWKICNTVEFNYCVKLFFPSYERNSIKN